MNDEALDQEAVLGGGVPELSASNQSRTFSFSASVG